MAGMNEGGGTAFPVGDPNSSFDCQFGMTLRDYFAGQALNGLLAYGGLNYPYEEAVIDSYAYADIMINRKLEREAKNDST